MIIEFSVRNFLSIKDEVTLSFLAVSKNKNNLLFPVDNGKYHLYPVNVIYGANASGKTNVLKALYNFKRLILNSYRQEAGKKISEYKPFKLDTESRTKPVFFEIEFVVNKIRHLYNVEFLHDRIVQEELSFYPEGRKARYFLRTEDKVVYGKSYTGDRKSVETFLLPNRLFLSVSANSTNDILKGVYRFFFDIMHYNFANSIDLAMSFTIATIKKEGDQFKNLILHLMKSADITIEDIKLQKHYPAILSNMVKNNETNNYIDKFSKLMPYMGHTVYINEKPSDNIEHLSLSDEESLGTLKLFELAAFLYRVLRTGSALIIDEFNSSLHPLLSKMIVEMFCDPVINKHHAQLLVTTHDVSFLDALILDREQIWFTEKNKFGVTQLFSLDEFDKNLVRNGAKHSRPYLDGRFDAVPDINLDGLREVIHAEE